jgi:hypothetical protein
MVRLLLEDEEAMSLDESLEDGARTATVQVAVCFKDESGKRWSGKRLVKIRVKRDKQ